jgi:hypothetical protein
VRSSLLDRGRCVACRNDIVSSLLGKIFAEFGLSSVMEYDGRTPHLQI